MITIRVLSIHLYTVVFLWFVIMTTVVYTTERRLPVTVTSPGSCMNSRLHVMYGCLTWVMGLVPIELSEQPEWD